MRRGRQKRATSRCKLKWLRGRDLNPRPLGYEPNELPDCSTPRQVKPNLQNPCGIGLVIRLKPNRTIFQIRSRKSAIRNPLVGLGRFELPTSRLSGVRSNQLSYRPIRSNRRPRRRRNRLSENNGPGAGALKTEED